MAQQPPAGCLGFLLGLLGLRPKAAHATSGTPQAMVSTKFVSGAEADSSASCGRSRGTAGTCWRTWSYPICLLDSSDRCAELGTLQ